MNNKNYIFTSLNNSEKLAKSLAKKFRGSFSKTTIDTFPDGDLYLKFNCDLKKKVLVIVDTFIPNSDKILFDIIFACKTAKDLGVKKIILVAPYLSYMRQDKRFNSGEAITSKIMAELLNTCIDEIITIEPHIHRYNELEDIFKCKCQNLNLNHLIAQFIKKNFKNFLIIGPDWESFAWSDEISKELGVKDTILNKSRKNSRNVEVEMKDNLNVKGKNIIIVDDIISTGNTIIKAKIKAKKLGAKKIYAIGIHGLFVENGFSKMSKAKFDGIFTAETILHKSNKIKIDDLLVDALLGKIKKKKIPKKKLEKIYKERQKIIKQQDSKNPLGRKK